MPVINFSVGDILRNKVLDDKWYSWLISNIEGPKPNAKKDGVNYVVSFTLIDQGVDLDGKEIQRYYSSKAISMLIPLVAAARGIKLIDLPKEAFSFDIDELKGKKVDAKAETELYEGNPKNVLNDFMPYKSASNTPAF